MLKTTNGFATLKDIVTWQQKLTKSLVEYAPVTGYIRKPISMEDAIIEDLSEQGLQQKFPEFSELNNDELKVSIAKIHGLSIQQLEHPDNSDIKSAVTKATSTRVVQYMTEKPKIVKLILDSLAPDVQERLWTSEASHLITSNPLICYKVIIHLVIPKGEFRRVELAQMLISVNNNNPLPGQSLAWAGRIMFSPSAVAAKARVVFNFVSALCTTGS